MAIPFRLRLAKAILGTKAKDFIPALNPLGDMGFGSGGRINTYSTKLDQMSALKGWVFTANSAIADPCAAVELKLYRKKKDGDREEVTTGPEMEILELLGNPNAVHTGEQLLQLHYTYMNIVGESYIFMRDLNGGAYIPTRGRLPAALDIFPAHQAQFTLGQTYNTSIVRMGAYEYPISAFIRDLNPDPGNPYIGRSIVAASAAVIDTDEQMKAWNQQLFANNARPSLIFSTNEALSDESYERWKKQFYDEHTGTENAHKPLLIEGGTATPWMMTQQDLDFLASRKFTRDEILAMFRLSPGMIGSVENVNRANLEAGFYINAVVNIVPRVRQFVRQVNATLVKVYDPTLEIDFVSPVPDDGAAKLKIAQAGVNKWYTPDEVRDMYGEKPLPGGLGEQIVVPANSVPLDSVIAGTNMPAISAAKSFGSRHLTKQVSATEFPGLYDDLDIDMDALGCIMLDTETLDVLKYVDGGPDDLVQSTTRHDHTMGAVAETEAHVTLLFGLLENGNVWKDKVDTVLKDWKIDTVTIASVSTFDLGDSYAVVAHVAKTAALVDGHERLTLLPHIQTFSEYKPHLTLAYVKHDEATAAKWVDALSAQYNGSTLKTKGINYGDLPDDSSDTKSLTGVKKKDLTPEQRQRQGDQKVATRTRLAERYEVSMLTTLRSQFEMQRAHLMANLSPDKIGKSYRTKDYLDDLIDWSQATDDLRRALQPLIYTILVETGRAAMTDLALDGSMYNPIAPAVTKYFTSRSLKIAQDVNDETAKQLRASLSQGVAAGEAMDELSARVQSVMGSASTMRADRIARTEVSRAQGAGDVTAWKQSGVVSGKEWFCAEDDRTCSFCLELDGKIVSIDDNFFDKGDIYTVDNKPLNLNYDDVPSNPLHVSCRCTILSVRV